MIERIPDQIPVQTGEWHGTTFDIIPKETFAMACRKINELVDAVNALVYEHDKDSDWYDGQTRPENVQPDTETRPENVQKEPITLLDIFNEMGEMYSSLWNKMEDIHHDLKTKGGDNE